MGLKTITVYKEEVKNDKFTPKFVYLMKKLEHFPYVIEDIINDGPANGIDIRNFKIFGKPYIRVSDIKRCFISYSDIKFVALNEVPKKIKLQEGDLLISRKGTPGIVSIVMKRDLNSVIGTEAILIRPKKKFDSYYLVAFLNSKIFFEQLISSLSGTVATGINHPSLLKLKIFYEEHFSKKISKKVREAINYDETSLDLIHQAQQLFYQKLGINFSKIRKENFYSVNLSDFKDVDLWIPKYSYLLYVNTLKAIKQKWQTVPISKGKIATIKKGDEVGSKNYNSYLDRKDSDAPFIRTSDLVNYEVDQFPDFYIPTEIYKELNQDVQAGDILFTKDGKIGMTAMLTPSDKVIIASGLSRLRLKKEAKEYNLTPEYLFLVLSLKETGLYPALRRTVIASTIPHLREERLKEIEIPILDKSSIDEITQIIKRAFELKDKKKKLIQEVRKEVDNYLEVQLWLKFKKMGKRPSLMKANVIYNE